eukprot:TRINITY_DN30537_c0_g1_i1.p1 TRINITY_DN30537_c0_g1~~TRINITY_DN30537_c0_g1_i1.p1  ORF type:complete len:371 (+),score=45.41 TRINITY_DN30537_c0_g1_i1:161-1273(+)
MLDADGNNLSEKFHVIQLRNPHLSLDSTALETGYLRAPSSRRCASTLVATLGTLGTVWSTWFGIDALVSRGHHDGSPLDTRLLLFWGGAAVIGFVLLCAYLFLKTNGAFAVYALIERVCVTLMWFWAWLGCSCYVEILRRQGGMLNVLGVVRAVLAACGLFLCVLLVPAIVGYYDWRHRERLRDPDSSAKLWGEMTGGLDDVYEASASLESSGGQTYRVLPANVKLPRSFRCGVGSARGHNCWISSLVQLLRGFPESGIRHDAECAEIREQGVAAGVWRPSPDHITAGPEEVQVVVNALGLDEVPTVVILAGLQADMRQEVPGMPGSGTIYLFNPVGVHFDPLWPGDEPPFASGASYEMPLIVDGSASTA